MASRKRDVFKGGPREKPRLSTKKSLRQKLAQKRAELRALEALDPASTGLPEGGLEGSLTEADVEALLRADRSDPGPDAPAPPPRSAPASSVRQAVRKGMGQRFDDWFSRELKGAARGARKAGYPGVHSVLKKVSRQGKYLRGAVAGALPFAIPTLLEAGEGLAMDVADPLAKALTGTGVGQKSLDETLRIQDESEQAMLMENLRQQQIEEMARVNEQRIMQVAPHLANQLLAGRRLPQGAAVFGTQQRTDIFREFARQMATDPRLARQPQQEPFP